MKNRTFLFLTGTIVALVGGVTEAGCSSKSDTTPTQGATATGSGGTGVTSSTGTKSTSTSTTGSTTGATGGGGGGAVTVGSGGDTSSTTGTGGGGGTPGTDCAAIATTTCNEEKMCNANIFAASYLDLATCVDVQTTSCKNAKPSSGTVADPVKCLADRTATCATYLSSNLPASCAPKYKPGKIADMVDCDNVTSRCVAGEYCYSAGDPAICSYCVATTAIGDACGGGNAYTSTGDTVECDGELNQTCIQIFDATTTTGYKQSITPGTDDPPTCQIVTYGASGADCFANSTKQCDAGLGLTCGVNKKCVPFQALNQDCTTLPCDALHGLSCQTQTAAGVTSKTCQPAVIVPVGATCGLVLGSDGVTMEQHSCAAAQAICSTDGTTKCIALVKKGEVCVNTPNNCEQYTGEGLLCTAGTCQLPAPAAACTKNPNLP